MSRSLSAIAKRLPGLLLRSTPVELAAVDASRFAASLDAFAVRALVLKARFYNSSAAAQQASTATSAEVQATESTTADAPAEVQYTHPLGPPSVPAFGLGLLAILAAVAGEWVYFTDEFIEMVGFWALFLTVYRVAAPTIGSMFDETTNSVRASELDKIRAAREALGLEELAKRYAPATDEAEKLVSRELEELKAMTPSVLAYTRSLRTKELLDMHMELAALKDEQMKDYLIKRFRRRVLDVAVNGKKK